ncbi:MAG: hypothetical protein IJU79_07025 [Desulfovibrionaceae bacterium]|nr:hypothetical protein [Desulfovibrionaceae bacterium]
MKSPFILFLTLCFFLTFLTACGPSNEIRLLAVAPPKVSTLPRPNAPSVAIVEFKDERQTFATIGERRDGSAFTTTASPTLWISHALADQLTTHGLQVSYATTMDQARRGNPDYIVWGKLNRLWLKETSATNLETKIEAQVNLANRERRIMQEPRQVAESRSAIPTSSTAQDLLRDAMVDLVEPMASKLAQIIWDKH